MKVTTSCYGRFHIFDQAAQLHRHGMLHRIVTDYPKFMTRRWGIPDENVTSLLANGIYGRIATKTFRWLDASTRDRITEAVHHQFSSRLAKKLPPDSDIFIGLSSYCLEAVEHANKLGMKTIVDHGSLHQATERRLQIEESELWGFNSEESLPPNWLIEKENVEFELADRVMVLSEIAKRTMVEQGVPADKVFVNHCGVDLDQFYSSTKQDNVFRIVQCGGIRPRKGVQYLLKAFSELKLPNSELWFIGGGLDSSSLQPVVQQYRANNILFKGSFPQSQLYELYSQGSIFVLASVADGFGMVVPQAMACGLPVIVTENVGAADIVVEGANGYVIPIRNVDALKEKILYLYENHKQRDEMGRSAMSTVAAMGGWSHYGDQLEKYLTTLL